MPPFNWRIESDAGEKKLNLTSPNNTLITIRSMGLDANATEGSGADSIRGAIVKRYPDAKIIEEFESHACGVAGRAFDLELPGSRGSVLLSRIVCVPLNGEMIEFHLAARVDRFRGDSMALSSLLTSFQFLTKID